MNGSLTVGPPCAWYARHRHVRALNLGGLSGHVNATGVVYFGSGLNNSSPLLNALSVVGSLLLGGNAISSTYLGNLTVTYNSTYTSLPDMTPTAPYLTPQSVKLISWSP